MTEIAYCGELLHCARLVEFYALTFFVCKFTDTDSCIFAAADATLSNCLRPEFKDRWNEIAAFLFEDPTSEKEQSGYFKVRLKLPNLVFTKTKKNIVLFTD